MNKSLHLVIGLGPTGLSCVRYLVSKNIPVMVADSREYPPKLDVCQTEFPTVPIHTGAFQDAVFSKADVLVVSPGVSLKEPCITNCINNNIPVIGDVEIFAREAKAPIIAITGSNGKSTLTTLMGECIRACDYDVIVCGNIGLPVLDALMQKTPDYYVVELSSFQLDTTHSLRAAVAVVINVSPDHMDRYATEADYLASKQRIYQHCEHAVVNADEPFIWESLSFSKTPVQFTLQNPHQNEWGIKDHCLAYGDKNIISISELLLQQRHNCQNFLVALAMGTLIKLPLEKMLTTFTQFKGLAHRCQLVKKVNGVAWYNDSKATNVGAAIAVIESMAQTPHDHLILLAGGDSKGVSLLSLQAPVKKWVSHVILFGRDADLLDDVLKNQTHVIRVKNLKDAVQTAYKLATNNDVVLLAPACASTDQYENYMARGNDFIQSVESL